MSAGDWKHLKLALTDMRDLLRCWSCNKIFLDPVKYQCGHYFCGSCSKASGTKCSSCDIPSELSDIQSDCLISNIVGCFQTLCSEINFDLGGVSDSSTGNSSKKSSLEKILCGTACLNETSSKCNAASTGNKPSYTEPNVGGEIEGKMSQDKNSSEQPSRKKSSGSEVNLDSKNDKSEFLRPSRVRKTSLNDSLKSRKNKNSSSRSSLGKQLNTSNDESVGRTSDATKTPVSKYPCHDSFTSGNQTCKEAVQDSFITPKKQRRTSKLQNMSTSSSDRICTAAVKTTPRKSNTPGREFVKRNHLGETPLHVACIKGNVDRVRALLEASATPNTKDNAGWTPLHEASNHGHIEIVKLLLDAGALVNVPGAQNITPLHEAVSNNHLPIVKLLVAHGADINARSSQGKSPLEESSSLDIREALLKTEVVAKNPVSSSAAVKDNSTLMETVLFGEAGLTPEEKTQLAAAASKLKARVAAIFGVDVTHLVVPSDKQNTCPPSMDVLCAILQGTFILTREWLTSDISFDHEVYELSGVTDFADADAPKLSRLNAQKQLPGLFNGCHFYVTNNTHYKMTSCLLSKVNIITLIKRGGGIVLTRKPDPEAIPATEQTVPYHAPRNSTLSSTSHFIIYSPGKGEPELKYNMKHCKTLPIEWLIHCILNWQLIDP